MDKNNDNIQVNKISKWAEAPVSIKNLRNYISESWKNYAAPPCCPQLDPSCQDSICESMMTLLESVLDDYNELEAIYKEVCGEVSRIDAKNKLIDELNQKIEDLESKNKSLDFKYRVNQAFGRVAHITSLKEKIEMLEKENETLKEKLNEHYRLCRTCCWKACNKRKDKVIEDLKVENNNLTTDNKRLNDAVDAWRKENKKLKEIVKSLRRTVRFLDEGGSYDLHSCPVACECENFKPKVHHSCDPLNDLPDVEHS